MKHYFFPLALAFNSFSLQALIVFAGVTGRPALAADLSLAQAAMIALFFSFSGNARNLVLKSSDGEAERSILQLRLIGAPVLAALALLVSIKISRVDAFVSAAVVLRQLSEWFAEIELARREKNGEAGFALNFLAVSVLPLAALAAALLWAAPLFKPLLLVWGILPLLLCSGGIARGAASLARISIEWAKILPNCSSTLVIGMVVFFFRLLVSGFAGKEIAGQLFTAFAIGGMASSVYERTIGPSFKVSAALAGGRSLFFRLAMALPVAGVAIMGALLYFGGESAFLQKNFYLAAAAGFSLVGGYVMIGAQTIKIDLLHSSGRDDVFMADLLSNFAILVSVPVSFLLFGEGAFVALYLSNAVIVYACYWLMSGGALLALTPGREKALHTAAAFCVVMPLFFQLGAGVYRLPVETYDWGGRLSMLPLPLSVFAFFPLILVLHYFNKARIFSTFTSVVFCAMMCGVMVTYSGDSPAVKDKVMLALQYLLPFFGLVLAEHAGSSEHFSRRMAKVFFYVLLLVVPAQIAVTLNSDILRLQAALYLFTVYDNLQYAPVVMVSAFLVSLFYMHRTDETKVLLFLPLMCLYAVLSWSMLAGGILLAGLALFLVQRKLSYRVILSVVAGLAMFLAVGGQLRHNKVAGKFSYLTGAQTGMKTVLAAVPNVTERFPIWSFYARGIRNADPRTFLLGHPQIPPRKDFPSAHNYYLDMLYNFGLAAMAPVLLLIIYTIVLAWRRRAALRRDHGLLGLTFVVFCLVFLDNSLKVGFRQPYAGIFSFFLWGLLVTRLRALTAKAP
jgi:hypothetical protein